MLRFLVTWQVALFTWWIGKNEPGLGVPQRASGVLDVLSMLGYVVAPKMEQREDS